jgi:molybdenum cofactor biosynthesis protein B
MVREALKDAAIDVALVTGGTGIAPRDRTPEAVRPLLEIELPGFGERFRARSVEHIGEAAWLSRTFAGVARGRLVVVLPGSPAAVDLALREVLLPELGHALRLLGRFST